MIWTRLECLFNRKLKQKLIRLKIVFCSLINISQLITVINILIRTLRQQHASPDLQGI